MQAFDHDFIAHAIKPLESLDPQTEPRWGKMCSADLLPHLIELLRYSMGKSGTAQFMGSWLTRVVLKPLLLKGILPLPKGLRGITGGTDSVADRVDPEDIETLHAVLEEYMGLVERGEFAPADHPYFGEMSVDDWAAMHVIHFEHHLKQFGL